MIRFDESFNWLAVLKDLAAGWPLSLEDHAQLVTLAHNWPTCACGQLCKEIPRNQASGSPEDEELRDLGCDFWLNIGRRQWPVAISTFRAIETRTMLLLKAHKRE